MSSNIFAIEDAHLIYKNFKGEARRFNNEGDRNFNIDLTDEQAKKLLDAGYNVKTLVSNDPDTPVRKLLAVKVSYKFYEPKVILISGKVRRMLTEDTIGELDHADIANVDLTVKPSHWTMGDGTSGITAYLNSMYVTLVDDPFAAKYEEQSELEEDPF